MPPDRTRAVAAILLAAGLSQRMRGANKLLLDVSGQPMVRRAARTLLASHIRSLTVVLGHEHERVAEALAGLPLKLTINPDYERGQMTSVRAGLAAAPVAAGYLIALGDQPFLMAADIDRLIDAFAKAPPGKIIAPTHAGKRGNPIIIPSDGRAEIAGGDMNFGCKNLIRNNPERVLAVPFDTPAVLSDIDTPELYASLSEALREGRLGQEGGATSTWK